MTDGVRARFGQLVAEGAVEQLAGHDVVTLLALDSGARLALCRPRREPSGEEDEPPGAAAEEEAPSWALVDGDDLHIFGEGRERLFVELIEQPRRDFDDALDGAAVERGFVGDEVVFSFPSIALIRVMITSGSPHFCRVGLGWLRTSELRELRSEIAQLAADGSLPVAVRDLAARLVVPA